MKIIRNSADTYILVSDDLKICSIKNETGFVTLEKLICAIKNSEGVYEINNMMLSQVFADFTIILSFDVPINLREKFPEYFV